MQEKVVFADGNEIVVSSSARWGHDHIFILDFLFSIT